MGASVLMFGQRTKKERDKLSRNSLSLKEQRLIHECAAGAAEKRWHISFLALIVGDREADRVVSYVPHRSDGM
jgi:hypothetical protein